LLGTPVCCGWGITGSNRAGFRLVCPGSWGKRPACRRRSLLGTPVTLVGHPGSGFCARIARLMRSRDAGVAGDEPRIRGEFWEGAFFETTRAKRSSSGSPEEHDGRCANHYQDQNQDQDGRQQHHQQRPARGRRVHLADPYGSQVEPVQGEDPPDKR
jgi:hypothetical protein